MTTWRWRPNDRGQLTNLGSSRLRQVSQHGSWLLITRKRSTWIIDGHFLPGQLLRLTADLGASENAHNWWQCKKRGWIIHQTPHLIFQFVLRSVCLKNQLDTHMTWHVDCVTHVSASHMLNRARVHGGGSPLREGNPPAPPRLPTQSLPFLQACVMSLSSDSWRVNEDVMRLADMQLIWFPPLPRDNASQNQRTRRS